MNKTWGPDKEWILVSAETRWPCRYIVGPGRKICRRPAVAELQRGFQSWAYCADHLYGRRIRDGIVEVEILVE